MGEKQYHHGGLREELISKGVQLLAAEGYEGFSMRKLAAVCNVSHAAPYKHFKSKEEIILAIAQTISVEFSQALKEAIGTCPGNPRMQLIEMGKGYVKFMVDHPDYFRFVFMTDHGRPILIDRRTGIRVDENNPLAIALECAKAWFGPLLPEKWFKDFMGLWSLIHGCTLMLICGTVRYDGDYLELAQTMLERYVDGNAAKPGEAGRNGAAGVE